ncbi:MAG TPA: MarR family transcriptional regulator [Microbacteriaceae bacterium]|nr:MarR family transcriptional regulator [Microbacteriaceae bacterium]
MSPATATNPAQAGRAGDPSRPPTGTDLAGMLRTSVGRLSYCLRGPAAQSGLTPTRLTALVSLEKTGPVRPGQLARGLGISAASMSRLLEALQVGGWVRRQPDPDDQRASLVGLSPDGTERLGKLRQEGTTELSDSLDHLDAAERAAIAAALPALTHLADTYLARHRRRDEHV